MWQGREVIQILYIERTLFKRTGSGVKSWNMWGKRGRTCGESKVKGDGWKVREMYSYSHDLKFYRLSGMTVNTENNIVLKGM